MWEDSMWYGYPAAGAWEELQTFNGGKVMQGRESILERSSQVTSRDGTLGKEPFISQPFLRELSSPLGKRVQAGPSGN